MRLAPKIVWLCFISWVIEGSFIFGGNWMIVSVAMAVRGFKSFISCLGGSLEWVEHWSGRNFVTSFVLLLLMSSRLQFECRFVVLKFIHTYIHTYIYTHIYIHTYKYLYSWLEACWFPVFCWLNAIHWYIFCFIYGSLLRLLIGLEFCSFITLILPFFSLDALVLF